MRSDGRAFDELRPITITTGYTRYAEGSALIQLGDTRVLCTATLEETVPAWLKGRGQGWVTAEYAMLPRSTLTRVPRESNGLSGRTQEIRRLIGRALRASVDLARFGEHSVIIDCDVIQADGGTRTASITGGYVALALAVRRWVRDGVVPPTVFRPAVAAVSVGVVGGAPLLDLAYSEDSSAEVDLNVVANASGHFIEVQGTAEGDPFPRETLDRLLLLAEKGIARLLDVQAEALS